MEKDYQVVLFYNYTKIENPEAEMERQLALMEKYDLTCRMIIAEEGVNGNFEGDYKDTEAYIREMTADERFADTHWKRSEGNGNAFPGVRIKVRPEILSIGLGEDDFSPNEVSGKYMSAEELHKLYEDGEEFYVIDMRNNFEHAVGYFEDSVKMPFNALRELPENMDKIKHLQHKKVITVCTGGVKCEKASGYLVKQGFTDVYQLHGGIHAYIEKYPNQKFKGKLYVYDGRVLMGFELDSPEHEIVSHCETCGNISDLYVDCGYIHCKGHRHYISCVNCLDKNGYAFCSDECKSKAYSENAFCKHRPAVKEAMVSAA